MPASLGEAVVELPQARPGARGHADPLTALDQPDEDGVDPDAVGRQLLGERLHERHAGGARAPSSARCDAPGALAERANVNRTAPWLARSCGRASRVSRTAAISLSWKSDSQVLVVDRLDGAARGPPRVVDDPVDASPAGHGRLDEGLEVAGPRHIGPLRQHVAARRPHRRLGGAQPLLVASAHADRRSLGRQLRGERQPQSVGAPGDEDGLAGQFQIHGSLLRSTR